MEPDDCLFRYDSRVDSTGETARCRLLEQIAGSPEFGITRVSRSACEACVRHATEGMLVEHPVLSSLLYQHCETALNDPFLTDNMDAASRDRLRLIRESAESAIRNQYENSKPIGFLPTCDVIVCASESTSILRQSIESVIDQIDAAPFLHLIDTGTAGAIFEEYQGRWNVRLYRMPPGTTLLSGLHSIVESLRTPFIACQSAQGSSEPQRLAESIRTLVNGGAEIFAARCFGESPSPHATLPDRDYRRRISPATMVMRRATFVDMGGIANGFPDDDVEFFHRAVHERRNIVVSDVPLVRLLASEDLPPVGRPPIYPPSTTRTLRAFARGFPRVSTACDIVLPFYGHLDYVEESLQGLVEQDDAEIVIHLIDDATPAETSMFLRKWSQHPYVRTYRNRENVGQFQSFNGVSRFFETDLAAVQDADDISLPHRISWTGQMLHYSGADVFGGAVEVFGNNRIVESSSGDADSPGRVSLSPIRRSAYPEESKNDYFMENPTAVFRVSTFRELGGFADFGDRLSNRTSLDTEFQMRCRYYGVRFALSREIVVRYRVHSESATQNGVTGWGTVPRTNAGRQLIERRRLFRRGGFDPKSFGALGGNSQITERC